VAVAYNLNQRQALHARVMNINEHVVPSGQHYSATNRVPNIQEFMQRLDAEKKQRDAEIDAELRRNKRNPDVKVHRNELLEKKGTRSVRDPVTGKDVEIRDADMDFTEAVENPHV
jgi:hypothetical protein